MKTKKISQAEARRLQQHVVALEQQVSGLRNALEGLWDGVWISGVHQDVVHAETRGALRTAKKLRHFVVARLCDDGSIDFYAVPARRS